ncbi:MAG: choice-of-anchor B family protein, partial [Planctomycetota bacterium]
PQNPPGFPSSGMTLLSWLTLDDLGVGTTLDNGNDCWGYVSPSGREYALMGHSHGTTFVEVTDPANPVILELIHGPVSLWRDIKVYQSYAYAVSEGGDGIQVIDMSEIDNGVVTFITNITTGGGSDSHNVAIDTDSGFLYRCGGTSSDGLRIYDLANPANPVWVAEWDDRYVHDAQVVTYDSGPYAGRQIAFACGGANGGWVDTGLDILDVTDKGNIILLSNTLYPDNEYSHQAWLSEDKQYLYLNDELDEGTLGIPTTTFVFDVSDLSVPFLANTFTNGLPAVGHNLYVKGDLIFEANYKSGLRVFDAGVDPLDPPEVAFFDTWEEDDEVGSSGLWSNYPFLPSGTILGSDRNRGLFVLSLFQDCNDNGIDDALDISSGESQDCNENSVPDECDIEQGTSSDDNGNEIPDECECDPWVRGETNGDGSVDIGDSVYLLSHLFQSGAPPDPMEAGDINADSSVNVADAVYMLNYLFGDGDPPPAPFPDPDCP